MRKASSLVLHPLRAGYKDPEELYSDVLSRHGPPSGVCAADIHLRPDVPICRTDDFQAAQKRKFSFLVGTARIFSCPLFIAGDLGHRAFWSCALLSEVIKALSEKNKIDCFTIPGQHDLPQHRLERWADAAVGVLHAAGVIKVRTGGRAKLEWGPVVRFFPYGTKIEGGKKAGDIAIAHTMAIENKPLWPGQVAPRGSELLRRFPEYSLILTGDNHTPFVIEHEGRLHINPGSMMRQTAAQADHRPRFYLWWSKTNQCMPVFWDIEEEVVSREHIAAREVLDNRIENFVSSLTTKTEDDVETDFRENLHRFIETQDEPLEAAVVGKIWASMPE